MSWVRRSLGVWASRSWPRDGCWAGRSTAIRTVTRCCGSTARREPARRCRRASTRWPCSAASASSASSDPAPACRPTTSYHRIIDFASDIEVLADDLGLDRFGVVGLSGGGPYTLAVAHEMADRVVVATLLGGMGPTRGPDAVWSYTRVMRWAAPAFQVLRSPVGAVLGRIVDVLTPVADPAFSLYITLLGFADKPVLRDPQFKVMFLQDLIRAGELRSVAHDMALFSRHWGFSLDEVTPPVIVWQGLADTIVPPSHGHHQAARLPAGRAAGPSGRGPLRRVRRRRHRARPHP